MYIWQGDTQNDVTGECCQHKTWFNPAINVRKALHVILTKQKPLTAYIMPLHVLPSGPLSEPQTLETERLTNFCHRYYPKFIVCRTELGGSPCPNTQKRPSLLHFNSLQLTMTTINIITENIFKPSSSSNKTLPCETITLQGIKVAHLSPPTSNCNLSTWLISYLLHCIGN